jgi:hypothetical protein
LNTVKGQIFIISETILHVNNLKTTTVSMEAGISEEVSVPDLESVG